MTEEEKQQAAAFLKLQEDVKQLVLDAVTQELQYSPYGPFATAVRNIINVQMTNELHNYRIVMKGNTAPNY